MQRGNNAVGTDREEVPGRGGPKQDTGRGRGFRKKRRERECSRIQSSGSGAGNPHSNSHDSDRCSAGEPLHELTRKCSGALSTYQLLRQCPILPRAIGPQILTCRLGPTQVLPCFSGTPRGLHPDNVWCLPSHMSHQTFCNFPDQLALHWEFWPSGPDTVLHTACLVGATAFPGFVLAKEVIRWANWVLA